MAHRHPFADRWNHNTHHYPRMRSEIEGARRVLDAGCGDTTFYRYLVEPGRLVVGLEPELAVLPPPEVEAAFVGGSAESLPFESGTFDTVTMTMVLHHVDAEQALREAVRVLEPPWDPGTAQAPPSQTWAQAESCLRTLLPGCGYRRLPLWRYLISWRKPGRVSAPGSS